MLLRLCCCGPASFPNRAKCCACVLVCTGAGMRVAEDGRRVSSRVHRKPLEWYRNEHVEYTRQHQSEWCGSGSDNCSVGACHSWALL